MIKVKQSALSSFIIATIFAILITNPASAALPDSVLNYYYENGIYYYNPEGATVDCTSSADARNYAGAEIINASQKAAIEANKKFYKEAADEYGFDWRILAVFHYKEYNLQRSNPENGQGIYQLYTYTNGGTNEKAFLPAGPISDEEFLRQSKIAAKLVNELITELSKEDSNFSIKSNEGVKRLFFRYNGRAQKYIDKAKSMGFSDADAKNGEGSPYVMNRYDAKRDPFNKVSMSPSWPGMYVGDEEWNDTATSESFGAYVVFEALGGAGVCIGGIKSGGVNTLDEARGYVDQYNYEECYEYAEDGCNYGDVEKGGNCVSFVRYFLAKYTRLGNLPLPDGKGVVNFLNNKGVPTGKVIQPNSVFSYGMNSTYGHTGIILGVDEENDTIYVGQMNYYQPISWGKEDENIEMSLSGFLNSHPDVVFAYFESYLKDD